MKVRGCFQVFFITVIRHGLSKFSDDIWLFDLSLNASFPKYMSLFSFGYNNELSWHKLNQSQQ